MCDADAVIVNAIVEVDLVEEAVIEYVVFVQYDLP